MRASARTTSRDADAFGARVEALWRFMFEPVSIAYFEIAVASRTDKSLASLMQGAQRSFWNEWVAAALESFPEWKDRRGDLELACGLSHTVLEGLAVQQLTHQGSMLSPESIRAYLIDRVREIFEHGAPGTARN
jgi:hypothetical protein